jgi:hypothetical protein
MEKPSSSQQDAKRITGVVAPSLRPSERGSIHPLRRVFGFALLIAGIIAILFLRRFHSEQLLFAAGTTCIVVGAYLLGAFRLRSRKRDARKLYRDNPS